MYYNPEARLKQKEGACDAPWVDLFKPYSEGICVSWEGAMMKIVSMCQRTPEWIEMEFKITEAGDPITALGRVIKETGVEALESIIDPYLEPGTIYIHENGRKTLIGEFNEAG